MATLGFLQHRFGEIDSYGMTATLRDGGGYLARARPDVEDTAPDRHVHTVE
jgi:hypothetical protein